MKIAAIIPAAGIGRRLKTKVPKAFLNLSGRSLLLHTVERLNSSYPFSEWVIVVERRQLMKARREIQKARFLKNIKVVEGGATRAESVWNGLKALSAASHWVLVHDAARPLVSKKLVTGLIQAAKETGAAVCGLPSNATVKRVDLKSGMIKTTEDRNSLYLAQTPQVFKKRLIVERYRELGKKAFQATDEAALFDDTRIKVKMVLGDFRNIKVTVPEDLDLLRYYLKRS